MKYVIHVEYRTVGWAHIPVTAPTLGEACEQALIHAQESSLTMFEFGDDLYSVIGSREAD